MIMRRLVFLGFSLTLGLMAAHAGPIEPAPVAPAPLMTNVEPFSGARLPISNPVYADLAVPVSHVRPLFLYQSMPDRVRTVVGDVPVGGDFQLYAVQLEFAFNNRLSLIAKKDGYIDFNPDATLSNTDGWANIAAGLKYSFLYDEDKQFAMAGSFSTRHRSGTARSGRDRVRVQSRR